MADMEAYWVKERDISMRDGLDPGHAIVFPTTWGPPLEPLEHDRARVVKMRWGPDSFEITYADGQTYTEIRDG